MRKHKKLLRVVVLLMAVVQIAAFLPKSAITPVSASDRKTADGLSREEYLMRARDYFSEKLKKRTEKDEDPNEVIRVLVELEDEAAAAEDTEYTDEIRDAETELLSAQESVIRRVEEITGNKAINRTAYLFNGFSIEMKRSQIKEVEKLDGVKAVSPVSVYEQDMAKAVDMTSASEMWKQENGGYTGEGIVIAIIDSGVNYTHPDMQLPEGVDVKFPDAEEMQKRIDDILGYGKYYTPKVPFGYSYGGKSDGDVNNDTVDHGLHVSGIAAGTGMNKITGVAPNAQLFAMQVFTERGMAYTDDIIKAVEDSVKLGADIINLSLGNNPGFYDDVNFLQRALEYAEDSGVLCCVAAGNDGSSSSLFGEATNDWGITDTGAVSAPSTYPGALSVASVDNDFDPVGIIDIYIDDEPLVTDYAAADFAQWTDSDWTSLSGLPIVDCGIGDYDMDFLEVPYEPYIALIERGVSSFAEKIDAAYSNGAAGVIIYNQDDPQYDPDEIPTNVSADDFYLYYGTLPAIAVSRNVGLAILEAAAAGSVVSYSGMNFTYVPADGGMSSFSSWGPTPTLDIKPEISAPGGNIMSISFGDGYAPMSGTSMATPYVSGASALALQALKEAVKNGELVLGDDISLGQYLKLALMNTADPIMSGDTVAPVRQQGAGMIDPLEAGSTRVVATYNGLASVALKEVGNFTTFTVTLTNYGTSDAVYTLPVMVPVYTDHTEEDGSYYDAESEALITFDKDEIKVPAGSAVDVVCELRIGSKFEEDHYAEAFIRFDGDIDISLPVLAFYGDWSHVDRIVDLPATDEDNILSNFYREINDLYYPQYGTDIVPDFLATALYGAVIEEQFGEEMIYGQYLGVMAFDDIYDLTEDRIAFSPNGDGYLDGAQPYVGMLRSAEYVSVDVLDANKNVLRRLNTREYVSKTLAYDIISTGAAYTMLTPLAEGEGVWDGTLYDQKTGSYVTAPEGQYYISIKAKLPRSDYVEETLLPLKLDVTGPDVDVVSVEELDGMLHIVFSAKDTSGIVSDTVVFVNGMMESLYPIYNEETGLYSVDAAIDAYMPGETNEIVVAALDYAWNEDIGYYYTDVEYDAPVMFTNISNDENELALLNEAVYSTETDENGEKVFTNIYVFVRGLADETVEKITVNGVEAKISENGTFTARIPAEIGYMDLTVTAEDASGKVIFETARKAVVDLEAPSLEAYVTDEEHSGAIGTDNVYCSLDDGMTGGYMFATKYDFGDEVPVAVKVNDDALADLRITWFEGTLEANTFDNSGDYNTLLDYFFAFSFYGGDFELPEELDEEKRSVSLADGDFEVGDDGLVCIDVPFFTQLLIDMDWETYEVGEFEYATQCVIVEATDVAGNYTLFILQLEGGEFAEASYEMYGDVSITDEFVDNGVNFTELRPLINALWYPNSDPCAGYAVVDPDDVDENGVLTLEGVLPEFDGIYDYLGITYNSGELIEPVTNEDGESIVSFDVRLKPGANIIYYSVVLDVMGDIETVTWRLTLYYLPEGTETAVTFDDARIEDGAVIYTNKDVFDVSGQICTVVGNIEVEVNGDLITFLTEAGSSVTGESTVENFNYPVALTEGENIVTVLIYDDVGAVAEMTFTVIMDTAAPEKPVIDVDENNNVTVSSGEEDVTLYYSFDGADWVEYTDSFTVTNSCTVYAKAVDKAGNESEVASLEIDLPGVIVSEDGSVSAEYPAGHDDYYEDVELVVDGIGKEHASYGLVSGTVGKKYSEYAAFDIYLWNKTTNTAVEADCELTVRIAVPEGWDPAKTAVIYIAEDGAVTNMNATIENGTTLTFKTSHLSVYALVNTASEITENPPATEPPVTGDEDGITFAIVMLAVSMAGLAVLVIGRKRSVNAR